MVDQIKLVYVSPVWPKESGISQYSECLLKELVTICDVTLVLDGYLPEHEWLRDTCNIVQYSEYMKLPEYDFIVYNFGNNPQYHSYMYEMIMKYPGYVILHDFSLYYLTVGYYHQQGKVLQKVKELEGMEAFQVVKKSRKKKENLLERKDLSGKYPMNREILEAATGLIVHSDYTKSKIKSITDKEILTIPHLYNIDLSIIQPNMAEDEYDIPDDAFVVGSAGFISESKQNDLICKAVKKYNSEHKKKIYYLMVGQGGCVDKYLDSYIIKTGFVENQAFFSLLSRCNMVFNLRNPYQGESSGPLTQAMALGKTCVVTNVGSFSEIPDDTVIKVDNSISVEEILTIIEKQESRSNEIGVRAREYVERECNPGVITRKVLDYMAQVRDELEGY